MSDHKPGTPSDDEVSDTSTVVYDHESCEQFHPRVVKLIQSRWPSLTNEEIQVDRMKGGGYNRVIGFSIWESDDWTDHILRIPRFQSAQIFDNIALLNFIHLYTDIPVPEVEAFATSEDNELGQLYMIQRRLPGEALIQLYPKLSHQEQCTVARDIGRIVKSMTSVTSSTIGSITSTIPISEHAFKIKSLKDTGPVATVDYDKTPQREHSILRTLGNMSQFRKYQPLPDGRRDEFRGSYMDQFAEFVNDIYVAGYSAGLSNCLCHLDFEPWNILFEQVYGTSGRVSGVLDWDSAILAPSVLACQPPMWIWAWAADEDEDERLANMLPETPYKQELKHIFEDAAGPVYKTYAYDPVYRLTRKLFKFLSFGLNSNEDFKEADAMLLEWKELRKKLDLKGAGGRPLSSLR